MQTPRVSVLMPVYNAGRYLRPALRSILNQSFMDWELILIDDGSTDSAFDTVTDLLGDPRVRLLRDGTNKGLAKRLNEGIDLARGQFIARMDQDDISYPDRFSAQLAYLECHPEVDVVACRCIRISFDDEAVGMIPFVEHHGELCSMPWRGIHMAHPSWLGKVAWFRKHRYAEPGPYFCEDQELLLRAAETSRYAVVPRVLFAYRVRDSLPWKKTLRTRNALLRIRLRHFMSCSQIRNAVSALAGYVYVVLHDGFQVILKKAPHANGFDGNATQSAAEFERVLGSVQD